MKRVLQVLLIFVISVHPLWSAGATNEKVLNPVQLPTDIQAHINSMMGAGDASTAPETMAPARRALLYKILFTKPITLPLEKLESYIQKAADNGVQTVGTVTIDLTTEMKKVSGTKPNPLSMGLTEVLQKCVSFQDKVTGFVFNEGEPLHNRAELLKRLFRSTNTLSINISKKRMHDLAADYYAAFAKSTQNKKLEEPPLLAQKWITQMKEDYRIKAYFVKIIQQE